MAFATAGPNEYLVIGKKGKLINHGTGVRAYLWPGSTYVLIPSTKQEATFEMTQETKDGIPLRFKGIVIYRIIDPVTASMSFNFADKTGIKSINMLINNICLGELRSVVSGMTMQECIEQRKTILTNHVDGALREIVNQQEASQTSKWGIALELVQVAQVFIVDAELRQQLEAEVRNEIQLKSDQSSIQTREQVEMARITSDLQLREQKLLTEKAVIRQKEEIEQANLEMQRRIQKQKQEAEKEAILLEAETFELKQKAVKEKVEVETPVRLLQIKNQHEILNQELAMCQVEHQVAQLQALKETALDKALNAVKKDILPVEQMPEIANSLSQIFQGANLSFIGSENQLLSTLLPLVQIISETVKDTISQRTEIDNQVD